MIYIDAHTHFGMKGKGLPPNTPEERVRVMDEIGMDAMITTPPYASISPDRTYDEANTFILKVMKKYPNRFYGLARINPHFRRKAVERARKWLESGFWGIKFHPRNEAFPANSRKLVFPIMKVVEELGGIVLFHTSDIVYSHPTLIGDVAENFPETPIIIGHMGAIFADDAILIARWFDNVYVDTSFCKDVNSIEKAVEMAGAKKVLYASDYPQGCIELETMKVKLAEISRRDKKLILGENAKRLLDEIRRLR